MSRGEISVFLFAFGNCRFRLREKNCYNLREETVLMEGKTIYSIVRKDFLVRRDPCQRHRQQLCMRDPYAFHVINDLYTIYYTE